MKLFKAKKHHQVRQPKIDENNNSANTFRRSRTLTGSTASGVRSANETAKTTLKSDRLKLHHLKRYRRNLSLAFLAVVVVAASLAWLLSQFVWQINSVTSTAPHTDNLGQYKKLLSQYYANRPLERFRFVLSPTNLTNKLQMQQPAVSSAKVSPEQTWLNGRLELDFRQPILAWEISGTKYYVDSQGETFLVNHFTEPKLTVNDNSGVATANQTVSRQMLKFIGQVVAEIDRTSSFTVTNVALPPGKTHQVNLQVTGLESTIKTQFGRPAIEQASDVVNAAKYFKAHDKSPQYIDTRVEHKAYYK